MDGICALEPDNSSGILIIPLSEKEIFNRQAEDRTHLSAIYCQRLAERADFAGGSRAGVFTPDHTNR